MTMVEFAVKTYVCNLEKILLSSDRDDLPKIQPDLQANIYMVDSRFTAKAFLGKDGEILQDECGQNPPRNT